MINVNVTKRVMRKLVSESQRMFPKECFSALLGTISNGVIDLVDIWIPGDLEKYSNTASVIAPDHWAIQAYEYAEEKDLEVLGSHHSHPYTHEEWNRYSMTTMLNQACSPSVGDWQCEWSNICAITAIVQGKNKSKPKTRTEFFGPAVSVKRVII